MRETTDAENGGYIAGWMLHGFRTKQVVAARPLGAACKLYNYYMGCTCMCGQRQHSESAHLAASRLRATSRKFDVKARK